MKTKPILAIILLLLVNTLRAVGVYEAFSAGQMTLSASSSSGYTQSKLVVKNNLSVSLDVDFSTACFVQNNTSQRVGLAYETSTGSYYLRLAAGSTYTLYFSSRCLDQQRSSPSTGVAYTTIRSISGFPTIVNALRSNYSQASVWSITNGSGSVAQSWQAADPRGGGGGGVGGGTSSIDLSGSLAWSTSGATINIKAGKVANLSSTSTSGSLRLRVWATRSRYAGGMLSGFVLGTRNLNPLRPGYYYSNISGKVTYTRPPSGTYYSTMTVEEYTASGWVIRDYVTFSNSVRL